MNSIKNFQGYFNNKKEKKLHEEIQFHNSIQDWVVTTIYQLLTSAWKKAGLVELPWFNLSILTKPAYQQKNSPK